MTTLLPKKITVTLEDGSPCELEVRQFPLRDYPEAQKAVDDEFALAALAVGTPKDFIFTLSPESFEELQLAVAEVNAKGFFVWSLRQKQKLMERINSASPQILQAAAAQAEKALNTSRPGFQPRAG